MGNLCSCRFFFAQGLPSYITKYCGTVSEELQDGSQEQGDRNEVTVVLRSCELRNGAFAGQLGNLFNSTELALDKKDTIFLSSIRRVALLYYSDSDLLLFDDEMVFSLFAAAGLCCSRKSLTSFSCGRSVHQEDGQFSCEERSIDVSFVRMLSTRLSYELSILRALASTTYAVIIDRDMPIKV